MSQGDFSEKEEVFSPEEASAAQELWATCSIFLSTIITDKQDYTRWIRPIEPRGIRDNKFLIRVPSEAFLLYLTEHYDKAFNLMQSIYMEPNGIMMVAEFPRTNDEPAGISSNELDANVSTARNEEDYVNVLNEKLSFETFLESECNRFARYVAEAVADNPGQSPHTVLFIHGPSGVGKTHLSQAIGSRVRQLHPEKRVCYISCAKFEAQFVFDCKQRNKYRFIEFYQHMDVLIIDDIQTLIGKTATQQAFFEIFNHLYLLNKQIVLTCDVPPVAFQDIEDRILTRIQGAMQVSLERPDLDLRRKILKQRVAEAGVELGFEVVEYIAENMKNNVRELEGTMNTLITYAKIRKSPIDLGMASRIMGQSISMIKPEITMEQIVREVSNEYGVEAEDLRSSSRTAKIALPRQIVMYLTNKHTEHTLVAIAKKLKRKNHTTVMHGIKTIGNRIETDKKLKEAIDQLEQRLLSAAS